MWNEHFSFLQMILFMKVMQFTNCRNADVFICKEGNPFIMIFLKKNCFQFTSYFLMRFKTIKYFIAPFVFANFIAEFIPLLRPDIVLQRLFGLADFDLLIAPNWGMKKSQIQSYIDKRLEAKGVIQGSAYKPASVLLV
jgi:hypothetical protein